LARRPGLTGGEHLFAGMQECLRDPKIVFMIFSVSYFDNLLLSRFHEKAAKAIARTRVPGSERKRIILEKALWLFADRGFHGVSVDEIASASRITKPVLYDHFSSKQDLYLQVSREIRERLLAAGRNVIQRPRSLAEQIRAGVEAFFIFAEENPAAIRILLSPPQDEKKLYRAIQAVQEEATASIMKTLLAAGLRTPDTEAGTEQLRIQAEFIKQGLHALAEWRMYHTATSRDLVVDAISQLIRAGLDVWNRSRSE
jgi:AcrR family transcriptional regulator